MPFQAKHLFKLNIVETKMNNMKTGKPQKFATINNQSYYEVFNKNFIVII